jgi:8-oxo-dGTP diphosphatase/2-hydroxy-dATP diphosphatase
MTSILPPGLEGNLVEYVQGGVGDWLPFDQKRFYTNAFIIQDDKVCTSITPSNYPRSNTPLNASGPSRFEETWIWHQQVSKLPDIRHNDRVILDPAITNRYNGFGGKVEPGETLTEAAIRELKVIQLHYKCQILTIDSGRSWH